MLCRAHGLGIETDRCLLPDWDTGARNGSTVFGSFILIRPRFQVAQYVSRPQSRQRCNSKTSSSRGFLGLRVRLWGTQTGRTSRWGLDHDTGPDASDQRRGRGDGGETHGDGLDSDSLLGKLERRAIPKVRGLASQTRYQY